MECNEAEKITLNLYCSGCSRSYTQTVTVFPDTVIEELIHSPMQLCPPCLAKAQSGAVSYDGIEAERWRPERATPVGAMDRKQELVEHLYELLERKDKLIAGKDAIIAEKDVIIAEKDKIIAKLMGRKK